MANTRDDVRNLLDGVRARLENERWFGVSHLPWAAAVAETATDAGSSTGDSMAQKDAAAALTAVEREALSCEKCALSESRTNVVFGDGSSNADLMFIGEAPGRDEDAQGLPFVGRAGQLLNKMIVAMGFKRGEVYIANILKCRPPRNRDPSPNEEVCCIGYLHRQIEIIRPRVIVALGRIAAQSLLETDLALGRLRGRFHDYRGTKLLVTYHPAFLLRSPSYKAAAWDDLKAVLNELGLPVPEHKKPDAGD